MPDVDVVAVGSNLSKWTESLKYPDLLIVDGMTMNSLVLQGEDLKYSLYIWDTTPIARSSSAWAYFVIKFITNPNYQTIENFTINAYYNSNTTTLLTASTVTNLTYVINPPSSTALQTSISVVDNDVLAFTQYTLTYRLMTPHFTNLTTIYISPPIPSLNLALTSLNCCLVVNSSTNSPYTSCNLCSIINDTFKFPVLDNGILIPADTDFQILLTNIYNPTNASDCSQFSHHLLSYYGLKFFRSDLIETHRSVPPTNINSPCQIYVVLRGDILATFPSILYAGFVQSFTITLSKPTKMLRVDLSCTDPDVSFLPNTFYFDSYQTISQSGQLVTTSMAGDTTAFINITHE
jgi:hypothetical protein